MSDVLVSVDNVSKKFCRSLKKSLWYGVQDMAGAMFGSSSDRELRPDEFWAVKDVNFELKRGECMGLIGCNGAGKTTLLRMLNGLIKPDAGRIEIRGRVGALIALGAGFNPILSGRENIYVNASVLGLSKQEIDEKMNEIIDFAEIGDFLETPVQNYSSGMVVRLGFSIATVLEPDVLLLDEVLAVGDAAFRNKCYRRIAMLRKNAAVIFVTHNVEQVARICDSVVALSHGETQGVVSVEEGINLYSKYNQYGYDLDETFLSFEPPITGFKCSTPSNAIRSGAELHIAIDLNSDLPVDDFVLRLTFYNNQGAIAADCNFDSHWQAIKIISGLNSWNLSFPALPMKRGHYKISVTFIDRYGGMMIWSHKQLKLEISGGYTGAIADCQLQLGEWQVR